MSETPKLADECKKLLDSGWTIVMHASGMGSYYAVAVNKDRCEPLYEALRKIDPDPDCERDDLVIEGWCDTDDFEPSQTLYRLTEKVFGRIV